MNISNITTFLFAVHFNSPHPPMVATSKYLDKYYDKQNRIWVPPSHKDEMYNSAYQSENGRNRRKEQNYQYEDPRKLQELYAVYYALIEEIDSGWDDCSTCCWNQV